MVDGSPTTARATSVHGLVAAQVARRPHATAIRGYDGRRLTYAALWAAAGGVAARLNALGVGPGDIVAIAMDRSPELVVAMLGVARSGAAYLALDPLSPPARQSLILEEAAATVTLTAPATAWSPPATRHTIVVDLDATQPAVPPTAARNDGELLYVAYTSGSTGRPKGVLVPHSAVVHLVTDADYCPLRPDDCVASLANPAFDATTFEIWATLTAGATVSILPPVSEIDIDDWARTLADCEVAVMFITTALFEIIAREHPGAFGSLRVLLFGGEVGRIDTVRSVCAAGPPAILLHMYGPTETTTFATYFRCTPQSLAGRQMVPLGRGLQHTTLRLLDAEQRPVPAGAVGELWISGPGVARGYLGRPDLTAERFVRLPGDPPNHVSYRTGDLARMLPDRNLEFVGRADRQVKLRGFRVELDEVEHAILATGLVHAARVEMVGDGAAAHLVGIVQPTRPVADQPGHAQALAEALANRLPGYMLPARWVTVEQMPVTSTGKIDHARLLAQIRP